MRSLTDNELATLAQQAQARFDAMSPSQKLRHRYMQKRSFARYMQKRSFARGMGSSKTPFDVHCANVDKLMPDEATLTDAQIGLILVGETI